MDKKKIYRYGLSLVNKERKDEEALSNILNEMAKEPSGNLLEVGVGSGRFIERICADFKKIRCYGIDVVPDFVKTDNRKIRLSLQSAEKMDFPDNFFSYVVIVDVLHHVPNREKAISEISRVCKPNGTIIFRDIRPRHALDKMEYKLVDLSCLMYNRNLPKYFHPNDWENKLKNERIRIVEIREYSSQLDWIICKKIG
jgi:ubiquinone/menaquinone biosynthesis C-methylase UbiE